MCKSLAIVKMGDVHKINEKDLYTGKSLQRSIDIVDYTPGFST